MLIHLPPPWFAGRRLGLVRRVEVSTWLVVTVMAILCLMLVSTSTWMLVAYDRQNVAVEQYIGLSELSRGYATFRDGIGMLEAGNRSRAAAALFEGGRLIDASLARLAAMKNIDVGKFASLRREAAPLIDGGRHIGDALPDHFDPSRPQQDEEGIPVLSTLDRDRYDRLTSQGGRHLQSLLDDLAARIEHGRSAIDHFVIVLGGFAVLVIFILAIFSVLMLTRTTRELTSVLTRLRSVFERVAVGDYRIRLPVAAASDVAQLFSGFNEMIERLDESHQARGEYARRLEDLAYRDQLTGLHNRTMLKHHLEALDRNQHERDVSHAIMFLDIDRFKSVNDSLGHPIGDALIQAFASRIQSVLREQDIVVRLGGDEFAVIVHSLADRQEPAAIAERILRSIKRPFEVGDLTIHVTTSIGIAIYPDDDRDFDELLRKADLAMYHAKENGRNGYSFYREEFNDQAGDRLRLELELRKAITRHELTVHYQPKFDTHTGRIVGAEALMRWQHPTDGMIPPDRFIPVLEDTGMIDQVGRWIIEEACHWSAARQGIHVAVNVATRQLYDPDFVDDVAAALDSAGLEAFSLELEITESLLMENTDVVRANLAGLRKLGIRLAIDDFGTGYSSLSYLQRYPVDVLKLDRSFIAGIDDVGASVVAGVVAMAHGLDMAVVAEGVEDKEQLIVLRTLGCDTLQGFLIARPMSVDEFDAFAGSYRPADALFVEQDSFDELWRSQHRRSG